MDKLSSCKNSYFSNGNAVEGSSWLFAEQGEVASEEEDFRTMLFNMTSIISCSAFDSCEPTINNGLLLWDRQIYTSTASSCIDVFLFV